MPSRQRVEVPPGLADPAGLVQVLHDQKGAAKIKDNKIVLRRDWSDPRARLVGAFTVARDLALLAKPAPAAAKRA